MSRLIEFPHRVILVVAKVTFAVRIRLIAVFFGNTQRSGLFVSSPGPITHTI
jgi:hypothetical protein